MKKIFRIAAIAAIAISASSCLAGKYMCNYALKFEPHGTADIERTRHKADSLESGTIDWYDGLRAQGIIKDMTIDGNNNVKVHAFYAPAKDPKNAQGTAVVVHGYGDNHLVFLYLVCMYRDRLNYNVMVPDLQYHGYSEGDHCNMGWLDRLDVEKWAEEAYKIFKNDFTVLHGVSMGAATVMMASGDPLPPYIKAVVEDCGYSSVWDQFTVNLKESFGLPPFPILTSASIVSKSKYGWSFKEASSVKQLAKSTVPMLFIHGDADDFVPFSHLQKNFDAKTNGYKEMWVTEGAVHANSYAKYPKEYEEHVRNFLAKVKGM